MLRAQFLGGRVFSLSLYGGGLARLGGERGALSLGGFRGCPGL